MSLSSCNHPLRPFFANAPYRTAESSLLEISELQAQLVTNLVTQNVHIDNLVMDSLTTTENIQRGNKELKKASEKASIAVCFLWGCGVLWGCFHLGLVYIATGWRVSRGVEESDNTKCNCIILPQDNA